VLLGIVFGLTNASFVWATKVMIGRMAPTEPVSSATPALARIPMRFSLPNLPPASPPGSKPRGKKTPTVRGPLDAEARAEDHLAAICRRPPLSAALVALPRLSGYLSSYCLAWVGERVVNDLRGDVLEKLSSLSLDFFNRSTMGVC